MAAIHQQPLTRWDPTEIYPTLSIYRMVLTALTITCLIIGAILSVRIVHIGGISLTAGAFLFPATYGFLVIVAEVYGIWAAFALATCGGFALTITATAFEITDHLPPAPHTGDKQAAFHQLFGAEIGPVLFVLFGYIASSLVGIGLLGIIAHRTRGSWLWIRIGAIPMICQICYVVAALPWIYGTLGVDPTIFLLVHRSLYAVSYSWSTMPIIYAVILYLRWKERPALLRMLRLAGTERRELTVSRLLKGRHHD